MTPALAKASPNDRPTIFFLHYLGGSAKSFAAVIDRLHDHYACRPLDLPGFGDGSAAEGFSVDAMADAVGDTIADAAPRCWAIVGHSMGAKVAAVVARRAEDGEPRLRGLTALVLLAGSPPAPEPMDEARRQTMLGWFAGNPDQDHAEARSFIDANIVAPLPGPIDQIAISGVLRAEKGAWRAWLSEGSREDWRQRIGVLSTPALIVAGEQDGDLGPAAQRTLVAPHFSNARQVVLPDAKHLLPQEQPEAVAHLIAEHVGTSGGLDLDPAYRALIDSDRVSTRTRAVLQARLAPDTTASIASVFTPGQRSTLRAVLDRIVPQNRTRVDLAEIIERGLADGPGDGWRFADLPPDAEAYRAALRTLDRLAREDFRVGFDQAEPSFQDALLSRVADCLAGTEPDQDGLDARRMALWFEDLRGEAVQAYVSHPTVMARIGFSGIANGGDGPRKQGFVRVGIGDREPWEPRSLAGRST